VRRRRWLMLAVGTLVVIGLAVAITRTPRFQKWYDPPTFALPQNSEVAEMRASLREWQSFGNSPAIDEFVVPAEHVPVILDWLRPAGYNREPWRLDWTDELGEIVIRTKAGDEFRLRFYWTGKNPVVFSRDGVDQFYGRWEDNGGRGIDGGVSLRNAVRQASKAAAR
jgi:hypothetical protein